MIHCFVSLAEKLFYTAWTRSRPTASFCLAEVKCVFFHQGGQAALDIVVRIGQGKFTPNFHKKRGDYPASLAP